MHCFCKMHYHPLFKCLTCLQISETRRNSSSYVQVRNFCKSSWILNYETAGMFTRLFCYRLVNQLWTDGLVRIPCCWVNFLVFSWATFHRWRFKKLLLSNLITKVPRISAEQNMIVACVSVISVLYSWLRTAYAV